MDVKDPGTPTETLQAVEKLLSEVRELQKKPYTLQLPIPRLNVDPSAIREQPTLVTLSMAWPPVKPGTEQPVHKPEQEHKLTNVPHFPARHERLVSTTEAHKPIGIPTEKQQEQKPEQAPTAATPESQMQLNYAVSILPSRLIVQDDKNVAEGMEHQLYCICRLLSSKSSGGNLTRIWNQERVNELRAQKHSLTEANIAVEYEKYLTNDGYNAISTALQFVASGQQENKALAQITLADILRSKKLWSDFAGLAAYEMVRAETLRYSGRRQHQSGVALQTNLDYLKKTALQHRRAFILARYNPLTREWS